MAKPTTISGIVENARSIIEALNQINPEFKIRGEAQDKMVDKMNRYNVIVGLMAGIDAQNTTLMNERNKILEYLGELPVITREVVAGEFGKNSNEYELVGGTRTSEIVRGGGRRAKSDKTKSAKGDAAAAG
jgi:hypothetical protein